MFCLNVQQIYGTLFDAMLATGTPFYCAPELTQHHRLLRESDVFSYGVIMWGLANGCTPYVVNEGVFVRHPHFPTFHANTPLDYALLALKCMAREPSERPVFTTILKSLSLLCDELIQNQRAADFNSEPVCPSLPASASVLAETSVQSPRKLFMFII